jgi:hypothetical protein
VLSAESTTGTESALMPAAGNVTIDVNETPAIVLVDAIEP